MTTQLQFHSFVRYLIPIIRRSLLTSLLTMSTVVQADWCSGSSWLLFSMPMQQRVAAAGPAVAAELAKVTQVLQVLAQEVGGHHAQLTAELAQEQQVLARETKATCLATSSDAAAQVAQRAQVRLDLGTMSVMQEVGRRLDKQVQQYAGLIQELEASRYELQQLQQRFDSLAKETKINLITTDLTIRSACSAMQTSVERRGRYQPLSREAIDQQILQFQDILQQITDADVERALESCDLTRVHLQPLVQE